LRLVLNVPPEGTVVVGWCILDVKVWLLIDNHAVLLLVKGDLLLLEELLERGQLLGHALLQDLTNHA